MDNDFRAIVEESTNKDYIGMKISTNLKSIAFPNGELINVNRRMHIGDGIWHLWNDKDFSVVIKEIGNVTSYEVLQNTIVQKTIKRGDE